MKLSRKQDTPQYKQQPEKEWKRSPPLDHKTQRLVWDKVLGNGKYRDKTLEWVKDNDDWYYNWMMDNNIPVSWGLVENKIGPKRTGIGDPWDSEYRVLEMIIVDQPGTAAPPEWYEEQT